MDDKWWVVVCDGVSWIRVGDIRDVVAHGRMELGVVGYMGGEICDDESVEEGDVAVAMGGSMVALER